MYRRSFNLELDLRITDWLVDKVRHDEVYAQNLYAAICNNRFTPLEDSFYILADLAWVCDSWSYAARMICDLRETNEFSKFYCSGVRKLVKEAHLALPPNMQKYVEESVVVPTIEEDISRIGWRVESVHWRKLP